MIAFGAGCRYFDQAADCGVRDNVFGVSEQIGRPARLGEDRRGLEAEITHYRKHS